MSKIDDIASLVANVVKAQGLNQAESLQVGAKVISLLSEVSSTVPSPTVDNAVADSETKVVETTKTKPAKVIARKGETCFCTECKQGVYKRVKDVMDPMARDEFVTCFSPNGKAPAMVVADGTVKVGKKEMTIRNIDGNVAIDCPLCKSDKTLWIIGHPVDVCSEGVGDDW